MYISINCYARYISYYTITQSFPSFATMWGPPVISWFINPSNYSYPPTPALAKAGAAPGTTAGVELVFLSNRHPKATSMASYGRPAQAIATRRPDPSLLLGGSACRLPGIRSQQASQGHINASYTSMASYGRPSFFWAVQRAVRQAFAANRHPKATSMASYGRPSLPFASP